MTVLDAIVSLISLIIIFLFLLVIIKKTMGFLMWISGKIQEGAMSKLMAVASIVIVVVLDLFIIRMAHSAFTALTSMDASTITDPLQHFFRSLKPNM